MPEPSNLPLSTWRFEMTALYGCQAVCRDCNKAVGLANFPNTDMTVDQVRRAVNQLIRQKITVRRFTITGGEPILHPHLQQIIDEVARLPGLRFGRVLTNDLPDTADKRAAIVLPPNMHWIPSPLDDPQNPRSGKKDPTRFRYHTPFWISPADLGLNATWENCTVRGWCGKGLDAGGWSTCGKAGMFGRLFNQNVFAGEDADIKRHISTPTPEICKHCIYGLSKRKQAAIAADVDKGKIPYRISPTFRRVFREYRANPIEFPRY